MLYSLPGGFEPNSDLRHCVLDFLWDYPTSMADPMECVNEFREENKDKPQTYEGDLETDYIGFLAKVQKAAKENPVDVSLLIR